MPVPSRRIVGEAAVVRAPSERATTTTSVRSHRSEAVARWIVRVTHTGWAIHCWVAQGSVYAVRGDLLLLSDVTAQ